MLTPGTGQSQAEALGTQVVTAWGWTAEQRICHFVLVCLALLTTTKCFCFTREVWAGPSCEFVGSGRRWRMGMQPSPSQAGAAAVPLHRVWCFFYPLANTATKKCPVEVWELCVTLVCKTRAAPEPLAQLWSLGEPSHTWVWSSTVLKEGLGCLSMEAEPAQEQWEQQFLTKLCRTTGGKQCLLWVDQ